MGGDLISSSCPQNVGCNHSSILPCHSPLKLGFLACFLTLVDTHILHVAKGMGTLRFESQLKKEQSLWLWLCMWHLVTCGQGKDKRNVDGCEMIILKEIIRAWNIKSEAFSLYICTVLNWANPLLDNYAIPNLFFLVLHCRYVFLHLTSISVI